jgi:hypothetical protein
MAAKDRSHPKAIRVAARGVAPVMLDNIVRSGREAHLKAAALR